MLNFERRSCRHSILTDTDLCPVTKDNCSTVNCVSLNSFWRPFVTARCWDSGLRLQNRACLSSSSSSYSTILLSFTLSDSHFSSHGLTVPTLTHLPPPPVPVQSSQVSKKTSGCFLQVVLLVTVNITPLVSATVNTSWGQNIDLSHNDIRTGAPCRPVSSTRGHYHLEI
jgi:hypothetical protein